MSHLSMPELLFLVALLVLIFVVPAVRRRKGGKQRAEVLRAMGFADSTSAQTFAAPDVLACMIYDSPALHIAEPVARGPSEMGETVIFDFTRLSDDVADVGTIVAFRTPDGLPDFEIDHALPADRLFKGGHDADIGRPGSLAKYDHRSHTWIYPDVDIPVMKRVAIEGGPAFADNFFVWSSDEGGMRRALTPAAIAALCALDENRLRVLKRMGWLMVYRATSKPTPPERYPALLQEAVQLVQKMDLTAAPVGSMQPA